MNPIDIKSKGKSLGCITDLEPPQGFPTFCHNVQGQQGAFSAPACIQQAAYPLPSSLLAFHPERHYLFLALQKENLKSIALSYKISPLETTVATSTDPKERRKAKKQLSWLRSRIKETNKQERIIIDRLGQITFEEESRQRWKQIEYERQIGEQMINRQIAFYQEQLRLTQGIQQLQLNPSTPEFQPSSEQQSYQPPEEYPFPEIDTSVYPEAPIWLPLDFSSPRKASSSQSRQWEELSPLEEISEWASSEAETEMTEITTPASVRTPKLGQAASMNDVKLAFLATDRCVEEEVSLLDRRRSMPDICGATWAGLDKVKAKVKAKIDDRSYDRYMGYCLKLRYG